MSVFQSHLEKEFVLDFFYYRLLPSILTLYSAFSFPVFTFPVSVPVKYNGKVKKEEKKHGNYSSPPLLFISVNTLLSQSLLPAVQFGMASCLISSVPCMGMGDARQLFS